MPLNISQQAYYTGTDYGDYQFVTLAEIIDNFMATWCGIDKIFTTTNRADVNFHAHRALQELTYDVLKSCKTQEIEICPNLKMPLPQDYVNYVKITSVDSNGIEHIIYPTRHTSNPFAIEQIQDDCTDCGDTSTTYQYGVPDPSAPGHTIPEVLTPQDEQCDTKCVECEFDSDGIWPGNGGAIGIMQAMNTYTGNMGQWGNLQSISKYMKWITFMIEINTYCNCLKDSGATINCGDYLGWGDVGTLANNTYVNATGFFGAALNFEYNSNASNYTNILAKIQNNAGWSNFGSVLNPGMNSGTITSGTFPVIETCGIPVLTNTSNAWENYSAVTPAENQHNENYAMSTVGQRFGLEPEHAQMNGSFFIDCASGIIHFSSNLSGKTVILKYISDGLGTEEEMIVHKFAEEAMYQSIAYGLSQVKVGMQEYLIGRLKQQKFAATRRAKIRLNNLKLEEISQVFRGKTKWIKH